MPDSSLIQAESKSRHGGARVGAGRKPLDFDARWFAARGIEPLTAAEILAKVCSEKDLWRRILTSPDDAIVLKGLIYLTDRRDGRAVQRIDVTSMNVNITVDDMARARGLVQDILSTNHVSSQVAENKPLMLEGHAGGRDVG